MSLPKTPYGQKKKNTGTGKKEIEFLGYSLSCLKQGGYLCAIVPYSIFCDNSRWRKTLILNHTIVASISVPGELFYPISATAVIVLIEAHRPQNDKPIFFARIEDDGFEIDRQKRSRKSNGQQDKIYENFIEWKALRDVGKDKEIDIPRLIIAKTVSSDDKDYEIVPEAHLSRSPYSKDAIDEELDYVIREQLTFQIKYSKKLRENDYPRNENSDSDFFSDGSIEVSLQDKEERNLSDFFEEKEVWGGKGLIVYCEYGQKELHDKGWLEKGKDIIIASGGVENGLYGFYDFAPRYKTPVITCPSSGSICQAFVQEFPCSAYDNTLVLIPNTDTEPELLYYIAALLRLERWRYRYGRQITPPRLGNLKIDMKYYDRDSIKEFRDKLLFMAE